MELDPIRSPIHLYEDGALNRRDLVRRLTKYTGSMAAALTALESAGFGQTTTPATCPANTRVAEDDPAVFSELLTIYGAGGPLFVYQSRPADFNAGPRPTVLVVHENQGLTPYIKDVTRRIAKAGYVGVAVDLLSRQGGTAKFPDPTNAMAAYNRTVADERLQDMLSTLFTFREQPYVRRDRLGAIGFCAGGQNIFNLAIGTDQLNAAVVFYGPAPNPVEQLSKVTAPLLMNFPELDKGTTTPLPTILTTLIANNKRYELHVYAGANHAFHNDTGPRYDPVAACDAWSKSLAFFDRELK